jgi:hypothetical protein
VLRGIDWKDQAIEADIKPTAFSGTDRWFGLVARYTDQNNYYYLALRQSNVLEIKRKVDGVFERLTWQRLPVALNQTYRLRLQAVGNSIKAYVDGRLVAPITDSALTHGSVGVMMYKTQADIDNVHVSPDHYTRYWETYFLQNSLHLWTQTKGSWEQGFGELLQTSLTGDARILTGAVGEDQVVQARVRPTEFAAAAGSRWFGLIARYKDEGNFYYVTLRNSNEISLRKLVDGQTQVLATAPLPVSLHQSYKLRLATVGNSVRVWVDGTQRLQATDSSHTAGRFGFATYKTAAAYDDLLTYDP